MLHLSYSSETDIRLEYQIVLKSPAPITLLAGSAPAKAHPAETDVAQNAAYHGKYNRIAMDCGDVRF